MSVAKRVGAMWFAARRPVNQLGWWRAAILLLIGWMLLHPVRQVPHVHFGLDEFEHLHFAYCIHHGMLPYRDFFEVHLPWLHYTLRWLFPITGETVTTIFAARWLMLGFTLVTLYFTYRLAREVYHREVGLIAVFLLSCIVMFFEKALEIRPDVPATACWLAGLWAFVRGMQTNKDRWYVASGLILGSGLMFTQKLLFGVAGIPVVLAWMLIDRRFARSRRQLAKSSLLLFAALAVPFLLTTVFFWVKGGLGPFLYDNFVMTSRWAPEISPLEHILQLIRQNPFLSVLGMAGWLVTAGGLLRGDTVRQGTVVLVAATLTLVIGLRVIPVPHRQYFLLLLPLWAIHAAALLWKITEVPSPSDLRQLWRSPPQRTAIMLSAVGLLFIGWGLMKSLSFSRPTLNGSTTLYGLWWATIGVGSVLMLLRRGWQRAVGMLGVGALIYAATPLQTIMKFQLPVLVSVLVVVALISHARLRWLTLLLVGLVPFAREQIVRSVGRSNSRQLEEVRYVLEHTKPDEAFFTGFLLTGAFRPHAYFYYMLHAGVRAMLTERQLNEDIIRALQTTRPTLLAYDSEVKELPTVVQDYIKQHYRPVGVGYLWERTE
jgi:4-amino-4-deoxy-L-arabinose transferase-like glycosyltransferase